MSCRGRCGAGGGGGGTPNPRGFDNSGGNASTPSHRTVHVCMERIPTRPDSMTAFSEFPGYGNIRIPPSARASTPGPYGYPSQFEPFGSQVDSNLSWMPKEINLSELLDQGGQLSSRFRRAGPSVTPPSGNLSSPGAIPVPLNENSLIDQEQSREGQDASPKAKEVEKERGESLLEWFDRSVEKELKKHKSTTFGDGVQYTPPIPAVEEPELGFSKGTLHRVSGASASQVEMCFDLRKEPDTELTDAVDKYAKAEAMCAFAQAVKAAEAAAVAAPPELVEEAALASARGYQTDLKATSIQGELEGVRPIEVVGYVGVTKPKYPAKRH